MREERIAHYVLKTRIAAGSFGTVYVAVNERLGREVAVKILHPHLVPQEAAVARFRREARNAAGFHDAGAAQVYDFIEDAERMAIVMELVDGVPLDNYLAAHLELSIAERVSLAVQVSRTLDAAHQQGLVHRDIKPGNILVDESGHAIVTDFGLSRAFRDESEASLTQDNRTVGTPAYMSPEQWLGETVGPAADIYSLGVVLYEMLAGRRPFQGGTIHTLSQEHVSTAPPPLSSFNPEIPKPLEDLVSQCLHKVPAKRPVSAGALAISLEKLDLPDFTPALQETAVDIVVSPGLWTRWRAAVLVLASLAVILLGALTLRYYYPSTEASPEIRPTRYVTVEADGAKRRAARFHNLTEDSLHAVVSIDGQLHVVPVEDVDFDPEPVSTE